MENKLKHLEFIQGVINRMANTSFLLKGWSITVIAGLFALGIGKDDTPVLLMGSVMAVTFWFLDSYYLWQERLFRDLYDEVRLKTPTEIDFSMKTDHLRRHRWYGTPFSRTLLPFYGSVLVLLVSFLIATRH